MREEKSAVIAISLTMPNWRDFLQVINAPCGLRNPRDIVCLLVKPLFITSRGDAENTPRLYVRNNKVRPSYKSVVLISVGPIKVNSDKRSFRSKNSKNGQGKKKPSHKSVNVEGDHIQHLARFKTESILGDIPHSATTNYVRWCSI